MRGLVHSWSTFSVKTSHGQFELTRFTMAQTWGKPPPSPLQYSLYLSMGATSKWLFVPGLPSGSPEIPIVKTPATLKAHNFVCRPPIVMKSKANLQPLSRAFQQYVACHLHVKKSSRFRTFNGLSFYHNLCFRWVMQAHFRHLHFNSFLMIQKNSSIR